MRARCACRHARRLPSVVLAPPPRLLCCHSVPYVRTVYTRGRLCEAYESPAHVLSSLLCHSSRAPRPLRVQHAPLTAPRTLPRVPMCLNIACARCASGQVRLPVRTRHERRESRFMRNRHSSVFHPLLPHHAHLPPVRLRRAHALCSLHGVHRHCGTCARPTVRSFSWCSATLECDHG